MHLIALQCARRHLCIANPYFIPDARMIDMLGQACRRGVAVKLMVAGKHNDTWWARQNSVRLYGKLLEAGVEIFEFLPTMLHQKIVIVDDAWASVGTANFDNRSLALNDETSVCFHDRALVNQLHDIFLADLERCRKVQLARLETARLLAARGRAVRVAHGRSDVAACIDSELQPTTFISAAAWTDASIRNASRACWKKCNADIVSLQEVVSHEGAASADHQADYLAGRLGLFGAMGETRKHRGGAYGNVTLSRWDFKLVRPIDVTIGRPRAARRAADRYPPGRATSCTCSTCTWERPCGERRQQAIRLLDRGSAAGHRYFRAAHRAGRFQRMGARTGHANSGGRISSYGFARAPHARAQLSGAAAAAESGSHLFRPSPPDRKGVFPSQPPVADRFGSSAAGGGSGSF